MGLFKVTVTAAMFSSAMGWSGFWASAKGLVVGEASVDSTYGLSGGSVVNNELDRLDFSGDFFDNDVQTAMKSLEELDRMAWSDSKRKYQECVDDFYEECGIWEYVDGCGFYEKEKRDCLQQSNDECIKDLPEGSLSRSVCYDPNNPSDPNDPNDSNNEPYAALKKRQVDAAMAQQISNDKHSWRSYLGQCQLMDHLSDDPKCLQSVMKLEKMDRLEKYDYEDHKDMKDMIDMHDIEPNVLDWIVQTLVGSWVDPMSDYLFEPWFVNELGEAYQKMSWTQCMKNTRATGARTGKAIRECRALKERGQCCPT